METMTKHVDGDFPEGMVKEIEKFFKEDKTIRGLDIYPKVFETNTFFPLQRREELKWMMYQARQIKPTTVMEIGADKGGGLYHWCKSLTTVRHVIASEIRGLPYSRLFERHFPHINFLWLPCDSRSPIALTEVNDFLKDVSSQANRQKIDCLFIDGEKAFFREDFKAYLPFMQRPGRVFFHDIQDGPTGDAFYEIAQNYDGGESYLNLKDWVDEEKRELAGDPARNEYEGWLRYWKGQSCGVGMVSL